MPLFLAALLLAGADRGQAQAIPPEMPDTPAPAVPPTAVPAAPAPVAALSEKGSDAIQNSVVKVFSTVLAPDVYRPWTKGSPEEYTGSGVVIEGRRILTNAHVVLYAREVQIQASQAGDKLSATVEAIAPGIDLAVLKLDDDKFFDTHPALPRAQALPPIKNPVMVYGYPKGGDSLSITKGIVSRIEFVVYNYPVSGLRIQIDAAINPGNSGGPAVADDKMVGLAFSRAGDAENIGYIIPCEEIELFLNAVKAGAGAGTGGYAGKPALYDEFQTLQNPALRAFLKIDKAKAGAIVNQPFGADKAYPLHKWDLVTKIGDKPVDDQGMVTLDGDLHVYFTYLVQKVIRDGKVPLTVVRGGQEIPVQVPALYDRPLVIPLLRGTYPSYFICGPLVFSEASREFISGFTKASTGASLLSKLGVRSSPLVVRSGDKPDFDGERLVVISSSTFADKIGQGYNNPISRVVKAVNDIPIRNLRHLVEVLRDSREEFARIEFWDLYGETMVFRRDEMIASTDKILADNGIRSQGSPDVLAVWNAKPAPASAP